ncbi:GNAT family N-acetyltransferase [Muricauda ruestringensis]|uniref:GNAT family N-acetyltransferase n=1 Tax=Flagellimonas aurea TaxID=2915619 RepID=A0ABS3GAL1_9FLAO|nr:GNAT family protein [Allomuricauda aurea]MBO0356034.1 GNAT family N-acetyltransferase [Allomuricauda aurea]
MEKWLKKVTLEGNKVVLIPMQEEHEKDLLFAASDGNLWDLWFTSVPSKETISSYINYAIDEYDKGTCLPFTVVEKRTGELIGSTRLFAASPEHRRLELGYTWYGKSYQGTGINTECKYLILNHAFEKLKCIAVEFRTHWHNTKSRNAITNLGAKQDGVLRNHQIDNSGALRDTVVFSIIQSEWPTVKKSLEYKISKSTLDS